MTIGKRLPNAFSRLALRRRRSANCADSSLQGWRRRRTVFLSAAAAAVGAVVMTAVSLAADGGDSCVAYINGTKHTDEAIVMAQMHSTMDEMAQQAQELSVERQMDAFFVESFNN